MTDSVRFLRTGCTTYEPEEATMVVDVYIDVYVGRWVFTTKWRWMSVSVGVVIKIYIIYIYTHQSRNFEYSFTVKSSSKLQGGPHVFRSCWRIDRQTTVKDQSRRLAVRSLVSSSKSKQPYYLYIGGTFCQSRLWQTLLETDILTTTNSRHSRKLI